MCVCYHSNGVFVGFQPGGRSAENATQKEKMMASGQKIHWLRKMPLVRKLHICILSVVYLCVVVMK